MADKKYEVMLMLGDADGDSHNITSQWTLETNISKDDLWAAYEKGSKKVGVDIVEECCTGFQDAELSNQVVEKLEKALNGKLSDIVPDTSWVGQEEWIGLFMAIAKLGNEKITFKIINNDFLAIGAVGLFSGE